LTFMTNSKEATTQNYPPKGWWISSNYYFTNYFLYIGDTIWVVLQNQ
jgi:hypothetical protein